MQQRPGPEEVASGNVYPGFGGFRYTLRNAEGRVVYDSTRGFVSRLAARKDILRSWPDCRVSFEVQ